MKKATILLVCLLLLFGLSSCVTVKKNVELSQSRANVRSIEIYNSEKKYSEGEINTFLEENEPVAVLKSEHFTSFLDALGNLEFKEEKVLFPIPMDGGYDYEGYIIAIVYLDGGYDIIAEGGLYSYAVGSNGKGLHKYDYSNYCGDVAWTDFIEEYIKQ